MTVKYFQGTRQFPSCPLPSGHRTEARSWSTNLASQQILIVSPEDLLFGLQSYFTADFCHQHKASPTLEKL